MAKSRTRMPSIVRAAVATWRTIGHDLFDTYHPERHYMRGPGPKWRAKHGGSAVRVEGDGAPHIAAAVLAPVRI